jgi:hypothetical protein
MNATRILTGRREAELLAFPSVRRMADILAQRCREASWVRTSIASLERFRTITGHPDLEELLAQALIEPVVAEEALSCFASTLAGYTDSQVSALAMGAKLWFRLNGVAVPWRPLPGIVSSPSLAVSGRQGVERVILLALIGSGLCLAELLRLRLGDVGSLDSEGHLIPDIEADPLAVQYTSRRGKQRQYITFLTYHTRQALLASLQPYITAGQSLDLDWPLIAQPGKDTASPRPATRSSVTHARKRSQSLIRAGSDVNVALCMTTGDFFREWGLPGSRFEGPEELNIEEFI